MRLRCGAARCEPAARALRFINTHAHKLKMLAKSICLVYCRDMTFYEAKRDHMNLQRERERERERERGDGVREGGTE